jgi:hypothetical protein
LDWLSQISGETWLAIVGLVLGSGGVGAVIGTGWLERQNWKRQRHAQWVDRKVSVYVDVIRLVMTFSEDFAHVQGSAQAGEPIRREIRAKSLLVYSQFFPKLANLDMQLRLLAPAAVQRQMDVLTRRCDELLDAFDEDATREPVDHHIQQVIYNSYTALVAEFRKDLDIPTSGVSVFVPRYRNPDRGRSN